MVLNKDFREFIESLNSNKVKYLIVGGYVVGRMNQNLQQSCVSQYFL